MKITAVTLVHNTEEVRPEDYGAEFAPRFYNEIHLQICREKMTDNQAQKCLDSFVRQIYEEFNSRGYKVKNPFEKEGK